MYMTKTRKHMTLFSCIFLPLTQVWVAMAYLALHLCHILQPRSKHHPAEILNYSVYVCVWKCTTDVLNTKEEENKDERREKDEETKEEMK